MITGNEPAMPFEYERRYGSEDQYSTREVCEGLTIRQHFSALAMQALIPTWVEGGNNHKDMIAMQSVEIADALIAELNKATQ